MSNIIKGGRIRSQGVLDFTSRITVSYMENSSDIETEEKKEESESISEAINRREEELSKLEDLIQQTLADAQKQAEEIVNAALEKAREIETDAQSRESAILKEAYHKQEEIINSAESERHQIRESAIKEKDDMLQAVEGEVVETMITLMQHIISDELSYNVDWLKWITKKMLAKETINNEITLFISSENMIKVKEKQDEWIASLSKLKAIEVNESLNNTTCMIDTGQGKIEYDIRAGLDKVISELRILKELS